MPRLLVNITGHGFGHAMQTCAVLEALQVANLALTIASPVPQVFFHQRLTCPFTWVKTPSEVGMCMHDAITVDVPASLVAYQTFHQHWETQVEQLAKQYQIAGYDAVYSNIHYLPLAAAQLAQIPSLALCSLHWADIFRHYCPEQTAICEQMHVAYANATFFLQPTPHMPMFDLPNRRSIGPLAQQGQGQKARLLAKLALPPNTKLVLIALGGFDLDIPLHTWPVQQEICWLIPEQWNIMRKDCRNFQSTGLHFIDLLASCDAVITKPGYGTFTECACNGVPVLFVARPDWPEAPYLQTWLTYNGRCAEITLQQLQQGDLHSALAALWQLPAPARPKADGAEQAAKILAELLL